VFNLVEKAILLIKRGADIGIHGDHGNTVLHFLLASNIMKSLGMWSGYRQIFCELQEVLKVFITAGADIYTPNAHGDTPTAIALESGLTDIWIKALEYCGVDSKAVIAQSQDPDPEFVHQYSKVTFGEYCQRREAGLDRFEEIQDSDIGTDEEERDNEESDEAESDEAESDEAESDEAESDEAESDEAESDEAESDEAESDDDIDTNMD
jgi:hypothetical protein